MINKLNQSIEGSFEDEQEIQQSRNQGWEKILCDGERSILPGRDHQISSTPLSPLDTNEEIKSFYDEKGQEGYRSIKAAVCVAVQVIKFAIKLNSYPHVCFFLI